MDEEKEKEGKRKDLGRMTESAQKCIRLII